MRKSKFTSFVNVKSVVLAIVLVLGVSKATFARRFMGSESGQASLYNCGGCPVSVREVTTYVFWVGVETHYEYDSPCAGSGSMSSAGCP